MIKGFKTYLVVLIDREKAKFFTLQEGMVGNTFELIDDSVPQKVKHGDDTWDAQDKIFRHIEDHLHKHLSLIFKKLKDFTRGNSADVILIGSHKPLFPRIKKHITYPLNKKVKGEFVTSLKEPFNKILKRVKQTIVQLETPQIASS